MRGKKHKAMADQLTTVSKTRLQNRVGRLSDADIEVAEVEWVSLADAHGRLAFPDERELVEKAVRLLAESA